MLHLDHVSLPPNCISIGSTILPGLQTHAQTDTQVDHATCDNCTNSPHLALIGVLAMRANNARKYCSCIVVRGIGKDKAVPGTAVCARSTRTATGACIP